MGFVKEFGVVWFKEPASVSDVRRRDTDTDTTRLQVSLSEVPIDVIDSDIQGRASVPCVGNQEDGGS